MSSWHKPSQRKHITYSTLRQVLLYFYPLQNPLRTQTYCPKRKQVFRENTWLSQSHILIQWESSWIKAPTYLPTCLTSGHTCFCPEYHGSRICMFWNHSGLTLLFGDSQLRSVWRMLYSFYTSFLVSDYFSSLTRAVILGFGVLLPRLKNLTVPTFFSCYSIFLYLLPKHFIYLFIYLIFITPKRTALYYSGFFKDLSWCSSIY